MLFVSCFNHFFHFLFVDALQVQQKCPICSQRLTKASIHPLYLSSLKKKKLIDEEEEVVEDLEEERRKEARRKKKRMERKEKKRRERREEQEKQEEKENKEEEEEEEEEERQEDEGEREENEENEENQNQEGRKENEGQQHVEVEVIDLEDDVDHRLPASDLSSSGGDTPVNSLSSGPAIMNAFEDEGGEIVLVD